jgi:hypothetical protein
MSYSSSDERGAGEGETAQQTPADDGGVEVTIEEIGPNQHSVVATATFDQPVAAVWAVFRDFEKLVAIALPGLTSDFEWLNSGSPDQVPSQFRFLASGARIAEQLYHRDDDEHVLRYRMLEPALGILVYDAELRLTPISDDRAAYRATRTLTTEPGAVEGLAGLATLETRNMKDHFAKRP